MKPFDWVLEGLGLIFLIVMFVMTAQQYSSLPAQVPIHFNAAGVADNYGSKNTVWLMPVLSLVMYLGLSALQRYPHVYNYPSEVTEDNAPRLYRLGVELIRSIKTLIMLTFLFLNYKIIVSGNEESTGLGTYFLPILLISFTILLVHHIWQVRKAAN